ncbi:amidase [Rhodococcus koreensis]
MALNLAEYDAVGIAEAVRSKAVSPTEVVEWTLDRIARLDPEVNAYTVVLDNDAREQARDAERHIGDPSKPLLGVPISIKDHIWMRDQLATNGSAALRDYVAPEDCGAVERLRAAGAIIVGKTNNPEFLLRSTTDNDVFGVTRNPWDLSRTSGGSSGGCGAAVAAGMGPISLGTDGGGSIRSPASFCGVVGLKPTFGLTPKLPGFRGWPSLSTDGPLTRSVRDVGLVLDVTAGMHPADLLSVPSPSDGWLQMARAEGDLRGVRIAYSEDFGTEPVDDAVRACFRAAVARFADSGCELVEATPPGGDQLRDIWWGIAACETFASEGPLLAHHEGLMTAGIGDIIRSGQQYSARAYLDLQDRRNQLARGWAEFMTDFDLILAPAMQVPAFGADRMAPETVQGRPTDPIFEDWTSMIYGANLTNCPALSVPIGFTKGGLPVGMQIIGRRFEDGMTLRAGAVWERISPWAHRWPDWI